VTQNAAAQGGGVSAGCSFALSDIAISAAATGSNASVQVFSPPGCAWTATSNESWITMTAGGTGSGNGLVQFSVAPNVSCLRAGLLTVAGQTFTVKQASAAGAVNCGVFLASTNPQLVAGPSTSGGKTARILFQNSCSKPMKVYWVDGAGKLVLYQTLAPGSSFPQDTFISHFWRVYAEGEPFISDLLTGGVAGGTAVYTAVTPITVGPGYDVAAICGTSYIKVAPVALDFGSVAVGQPSQPQRVTLTNVFNWKDWGPYTPVVANDAEFKIINSSCGAFTNSSCTFDIVFTPLQSGLRTGFFAQNGPEQRHPLFGVGIGSQSASPVIEYINTQDFPNAPGGHFFYSDSAAEIQIVDSGGAGHFVRTGKQFKAGGTKPLCRFYGNSVWGPNSHFFTIDDAECATVKGLQITPPPPNVQQWNYEGLAFSATPPSGTGAARSCASGLLPVYRVYNNAISNGVKHAWDSNHRYGTDKSALDAFAASNGWTVEGIAFCASP
jgi:hypothetical protein